MKKLKAIKYMAILISAIVVLIYFGTYQSRLDAELPILTEEFETIEPTEKEMHKELTTIVLLYFEMLRANEIKWKESRRFDVFLVDIPLQGVIGYAFGMYDESVVNIALDIKFWSVATQPQKVALVFHELSHDMFNIEHGEIELMGTTMSPFLSVEDVLRYNTGLIEYLTDKQNKQNNQSKKKNI